MSEAAAEEAPADAGAALEAELDAVAADAPAAASTPHQVHWGASWLAIVSEVLVESRELRLDL